MPESCGIRFTSLFKSSAVMVGDVRCRPADGACGCEECSTMDDIAFVRRGVFVKHLGTRQVVANANHAVFFNRDEAYRVSHPVAGGDDCSVFWIRRDLLDSVAAAHDPAASGRRRLFAVPEAPVANSIYLSHLELMRAVHSRHLTDIAVEERVLALVGGLLQSIHEVRGAPRRTRRFDTDAAHADAAARVRNFLSAHYAEPLGIDDVAEAVHLSPYHMCRVFRDRTGHTIHGYRTQLRLRAALARLDEGDDDLTRLALDLGFSDHSHFTTLFRRAFGVSPSAFRAGRTRSLRREMSKTLQA